MTAEIIQLRDFKRKEEKLPTRPGMEELIANSADEIPYGGTGIDGMMFIAPENDPA